MNIDYKMLAEMRRRFEHVELRREQMHDYQTMALQFMRDNPYSGIFIDMGLGKTVTGATLATDLLNDNEVSEGKKILIIGPKRVAQVTWPDEFKKWNHTAGFNLSVIAVDDNDPRIKAAYRKARDWAKTARYGNSEAEKHGREAAAAAKETIRCAAATDKALIHLISRDWIEWLVDFYKKAWPYEVVINDESSGFKDHNSGRFQALKSVRNHPASMPAPIKRFHILTATPATEGYEGLFPQMYMLDRGKRLGINITAYRKAYFGENRYTHKWELRTGAEREILAKISDICLVMKEEDYLPTTPPLFVRREVTMTEEEEKLYLKMEADSVVKLDDDTEVVADNAAALSQKLLQMASGVLYDTQLVKPGEDGEEDLVKVLKVHPIHDHKITMLKEIVEEARGKPILVGYSHKSSKDRILKAFPQAVAMDKEGKCIKKWNAGKIPMLVMHPASGGHGLNLQKGGHLIVFFDIPWSLELYLQYIGRLARQGQLHRVMVFLLICKGTLDETVVDVLQAKRGVQDKLFKIMKKMRRKLKHLLAKRKDALKENWDEVVEILKDYEDDKPISEQEMIDKYGMEPKDAAVTAYVEREEYASRHECCPNCGDAGGPCGPGSDCYDEL